MKQGQGLIRFITISMFLICLYYLSFTVVGAMFTKSEDEYVTKNTQGLANIPTDSLRKIQSNYRTAFRDSFSDKPFLDLFIVDYTYKKITKNQLNLGLDLKGGMSFVLEVNQGDIVKALANKSADPTFNKAIENAQLAQQNSQENFLPLLAKAYKDINSTATMAPLFASNPNYSGKIKATDNNDAVIKVIEADVNSAIGNTYNVIKSRINQFGVAEPIISLQEGAGRIIVELPGADDLPRVKKLLESSAKLQFWYTYDNREVAKSLEAVNETLKGLESLNKTTPVAKDTAAKAVAAIKDTAALKSTSVLDKLNNTTTASNPTAAKDSAKAKSNPLYEIFRPNYDEKTGNYNEGPMVGYASVKDMEKITAMLAREEVKKDIKGDIKFLWGAQPMDPNGKVYALYAVKAPTEEAPLTGDAIASANTESDNFGKPGIGMVMTPTGATTWERMTDIASSDPMGKKCIAIVLDNAVYSAPTVQNKISGGKSQITGQFSPEEAKDLSNILNSGKIDAPAKIIQEEVVGPSLGKDTINAGMLSLLIGLLVILAYMWFLFRKPGGIADICLLINLFFLLGVLSSIQTTLTLPGIAGIVLIIGAAVDANVIIFERIKEELRNGKSYWQGVLDGYKGSYWTIIDANATTLITSCTLMMFGYGPIKGFAYTLTFGIITSMFTAVLLTRDLFSIKQDKKEEVPFGESFFDKYFVHSNFQFIAKRKYAYLFSLTFIIIGLVSIVTRGFDLGVEFKGGRSYVVTFDKNVDAPTIKEAMAKSFDDKIMVKTFGAANQVQITTSYKYDKKTETAELAKLNDSIVLSEIFKSSVPFFTTKPNAAEFSAKHVNNSRKIDATIADDISRSAMMVSIVALLGIFAYVWLRFDRWQYSAGAIAALIHDLFFTLGVLSLFKDILPFSLEFNQSIIAAVLTIIGFSTNDTVVIFDRIREFTKKFHKEDLSKTINDAVNGTLSRTVMTATTLFIVSLILFIFGGESIRGFSFTMLIGILIGTLSSIFVASPVALDLINLFNKDKSATK
jgi:SecD/SecF fusion protein